MRMLCHRDRRDDARRHSWVGLTPLLDFLKNPIIIAGVSSSGRQHRDQKEGAWDTQVGRWNGKFKFGWGKSGREFRSFRPGHRPGKPLRKAGDAGTTGSATEREFLVDEGPKTGKPVFEGTREEERGWKVNKERGRKRNDVASGSMMGETWD